MTGCRWCNDPVHGKAADAGEHPCCAWWMGAQGHHRCVACGESRKARRERLERHERLHVKAKVVDPVCEHCTDRTEAQGPTVAASLPVSGPLDPSDGCDYPSDPHRVEETPADSLDPQEGAA